MILTDTDQMIRLWRM